MLYQKPILLNPCPCQLCLDRLPVNRLLIDNIVFKDLLVGPIQCDLHHQTSQSIHPDTGSHAPYQVPETCLLGKHQAGPHDKCLEALLMLSSVSEELVLRLALRIAESAQPVHGKSRWRSLAENEQKPHPNAPIILLEP